MKLDRIIAVRNNKTIYRDGDRCIKVFDSDYSKADILNEALNLARIEELGLHTPRVLEVTVIDGKWAIVTEYIKGKTLQQLMDENPDKRETYIGMLVDIQLAIHAHTCPKLSKLRDKMQAKISATTLPTPIRYDLHTRLDAMPKHKKVCHGDLQPSNIIIGEDGIPYVIDWAHVTQGNASADAARTYLLFWLAGDIAGAKMYLDMFCEKSHTDLRYVQKWMPIVAASQSVKGNEKEREFLLSWVDVVDFE